jgi:hypothetical protein
MGGGAVAPTEEEDDDRQMKSELNSLSTSRMKGAETKSPRPTDINLFQVIFDSKCKSFL